MGRTIWMLCLVWLSTVAHAADAERSYRRATAIAISGEIGSLLGAPLVIGGLALAIEGPEFTEPTRYALGMGMYIGGYALIGSGGAVLAGGSLAARRVLVNHGARISPVPGALSWATWGVAATLLFVPYVSGIPGSGVITLASYVGSLVLGTTQLILNGRGYRSLPEGRLSSKPVTFAVAPSFDPHGARIDLVLSF